jgi:hypothetical protein
MLRVGAALTAPATTVATSRIVREHSNAGQTATSVSNDDPDADGGSFAYQEFQQ